MMRGRTPVRKERAGPPRRGSEYDDAYLRWVRTLACIVCGTLDWIEAAHVGPRGLGQKCPDRQALPICSRHHQRGRDSVHVLGRSFWDHWKLDRFALIAAHNAEYDALFQPMPIGSATNETQQKKKTA